MRDLLLAVRLERSVSHWRRVRAGIAQAERMEQGVRVLDAPMGGAGAGSGRLLEWLDRVKPAAVILPMQEVDEAEETRLWRWPVVDVGDTVEVDRVAAVQPDGHAIGRLAAEHLLGQGHRHFAFAGWSGKGYSQRRREGFEQRLEKERQTCECFQGNAESAEQSLRSWLAALPSPVGIFTATDVIAQRVMAALAELDVGVPERAGVIGVNDDDLIVQLCDPPLTSVDPDTERVGVEAVRLAMALAGGEVEAKPKRVVLVPPRGVVPRGSTDALAVEDEVVARVLRRLRATAYDGGTVAELLADLPLSRRAIELRFREAVGRSIGQERQRLRFERVRHLLIDTDMAIGNIAMTSGYASHQRLTDAFTRRFGESPTAVRRRHRIT